jgi:predicted nucleotidyltransferase
MPHGKITLHQVTEKRPMHDEPPPVKRQPSPAPTKFLGQLVDALRADPRVVGIWAIGSLANNTADRWSDVDLLVAVRDATFTPLVAAWPDFLDQIAPTVFARQLGSPEKPTITAITPQWQRFDLTLTSAADARPHGYQARPLFVRPGETVTATFAPRTPEILRCRLPALTEEFLRVLGLLPVALGRGELIAGLTPVAILRDALIELYRLENGVTRSGAKHLNTSMTEEQRRALEGLPPVAPTATAIMAGHRAIAELFLPRARRLAAVWAVEYPDAFERATLDHLDRAIGLRLN